MEQNPHTRLFLQRGAERNRLPRDNREIMGGPLIIPPFQIHRLYLGGSNKVKDIKKIAMSSFLTYEYIETTINRFKINSESTG